ncbi:DUF721 domain-containing protein [Reichenbachiella sp.]|uniref:DUF721 domain-containing protein n=1 Tax=Reichenbachiella sp. TaxID=2184521 RepID=UPI003BAF0D34
MAKRKPHAASIRNQDTATVKDVIDAMLKSYNLNKKFDQTTLVSTWNKIMGKAIANRTSKLEVRNNVLIVTLNSAPLKHELNQSRHKVLNLLEKEFGKPVVRDVLFV